MHIFHGDGKEKPPSKDDISVLDLGNFLKGKGVF